MNNNSDTAEFMLGMLQAYIDREDALLSSRMRTLYRKIEEGSLVCPSMEWANEFREIMNDYTAAVMRRVDSVRRQADKRKDPREILVDHSKPLDKPK